MNSVSRAVACILAVAISSVTAACGSAKIIPGTYSASARGYHSDIQVTLTIDEKGLITDIAADASGETPKIGGAAAPKMAWAIRQTQRLDCDVIAGATVTSDAVLSAAEKALRKAGINTEKIGAKRNHVSRLEFSAGSDEISILIKLIYSV